MEKATKMLSLSQWPTRPYHNPHNKLSPITKRILKKVHLTPQHILPITFQTFLQSHNSSAQNKEQLDEYYMEVARRKKQVSILNEIRMAYILGKDYGPKSQQKKENRNRMKSRSKSKEYQSQLKLQSVRSKSKISSKYSRAGSKQHSIPSKLKAVKSSRNVDFSPEVKKQQSDYFVPFDPRKKSARKHSHFNEQESTLSNRHCKTKVIQREHQQYGLLGTGRYSKIRKRKESSQLKALNDSRELCQQLMKTVETWEKLDEKHLKEMTRVGNMSSRQRQRLERMHSMKKQAVGQKVRMIKSRLKSEGHI